MLAVRYWEGSFYTLFEKLKSRDSKFFNYFRMSVLTFEFLVMRLSDRIKQVQKNPSNTTKCDVIVTQGNWFRPNCGVIIRRLYKN
jgi:hypothetical protein